MKRLLLVTSLLLSSPLLSAAEQAFTLELEGIHAGQTLPAAQVFNGFGCTGHNISPAIHWKNAPAGTKSFALTMYDPDAPTGSGWWHWVVFNIPTTINHLPANFGNLTQPTKLEALKTITQSRTDFGTAGYGGPCPPVGHGAHRYIFTLHALKTDELDIKAEAPAAMVGYFIHANQLASAKIETKFERK